MWHQPNAQRVDGEDSTIGSDNEHRIQIPADFPSHNFHRPTETRGHDVGHTNPWSISQRTVRTIPSAIVNRLADEVSPYLRQHRDNPVDWCPWGEEAFERAGRVFLGGGDPGFI